LFEFKGVLRLGFPALETARGSPPSLRMTSRVKGRVKIKDDSRSFAALRMTSIVKGRVEIKDDSRSFAALRMTTS
jgi:hypothetical protein